MDFFIHYMETNLFCALIFVIMLTHDLLSVDRQEKQIKYDDALIAFILYFISDSLWAGVKVGVLPANRFSVIAVNLANFVFMAAMTYMWLRYVLAVEQVPGRERRARKITMIVPFLLSLIALVATYLAAPGLLLDETLHITLLYDVFQIAVPIVYIVAVLFFTMRRVKSEENPNERRNHIFIGFFPLLLIIGGLVQVLFAPESPLFCFCCTLLMVVFYIRSMDRQISQDPLTQLNNRGQLMRYVSQKSNLRMDGRMTCVVMMDVNDFKSINDTFGHAEGDRALTLIADALRETVRSHSMPVFLCRYGGDEFILVAHPVREEELTALIAGIRSHIRAGCAAAGTPYTISVSAGFATLTENDSFQQCVLRADQKQYWDKADSKRR